MPVRVIATTMIPPYSGRAAARIHQVSSKTVTRHAGCDIVTCDCLETRPSHTLFQAAPQVSSTGITSPALARSRSIRVMQACVARLVSRACLHEKRRCGPAGDWLEQVRSRSKRPATPCRHDPKNKVLSRDHEFCRNAIRPLCFPSYPLKDHPVRSGNLARVATAAETVRLKASAFLAR
jgi:hypothetical protein